MRGVNVNLSRLESRGFNESKRWVADQLASDPKEGLLKVVVTLCTEFVILERPVPEIMAPY